MDTTQADHIMVISTTTSHKTIFVSDTQSLMELVSVNVATQRHHSLSRSMNQQSMGQYQLESIVKEIKSTRSKLFVMDFIGKCLLDTIAHYVGGDYSQSKN